jgi:Ca2+-binding EF-hand superfamily protein
MTTISSGISSASSWGTSTPRTDRHGGGKPSFGCTDSTTATSGTEGTSTSLDDLFAKLDTDGDGSISQSELDTGMKSRGHEQQGGQNAFGSMGMDTQGFAAMMGGGMGGMPPPPPPPDELASSITSALSSLDADSNSSISLSEFGLGDAASTATDSTQQALFDMIDGDKSGDLSSKEVSAFADQMKALFEKMQQMGAQVGAQQSSAASSLSVTA